LSGKKWEATFRRPTPRQLGLALGKESSDAFRREKVGKKRCVK
jgi:hypothetical protein